ncbi:MAG: hypothetical protein DIZ80_09325 [endosymbiont of Galathealinum brachiosum]|uniref:Carboxylesterase n=1 Tax=endosymbiont of Galathealinum brachiosum TaxID=2200906 RepID=A0A370DE11_9GAMM|nr:MAG: hypothetical protein DIZ80_09325 [endosymbiont of Galathealinum brachiosum]
MEVDVSNFTRAESDLQMKGYIKKAGGIGKFLHMRKVYPVKNQTTIRGNRDTLYSLGVFDLSTPLTITMPDSPKRFQSMMYCSQDHSVFPAEHKGGTFEFTKEKIGTRYAFVIFRTFVDPNDPKDVEAAHKLQDKIKFKQASAGKFEIPDWDEKSLLKIRKAINVLGAGINDFKGYFGINGEEDSLKHLLGTAYGWGGNREDDAMYVNFVTNKNDGKTAYVLNVKDVPVDGFWSVSVYNADGFFEKNDLNAYVYNNVTAKPNKDGSFTIHFGGDPRSLNSLPITKGWNYVARLYQPHKEILDGTWIFPSATPVK